MGFTVLRGAKKADDIRLKTAFRQFSNIVYRGYSPRLTPHRMHRHNLKSGIEQVSSHMVCRRTGIVFGTHYGDISGTAKDGSQVIVEQHTYSRLCHGTAGLYSAGIVLAMPSPHKSEKELPFSVFQGQTFSLTVPHLQPGQAVQKLGV
jgi:hypothetical protein